MILIADSGATKTTWRCYECAHLQLEIVTEGMNPHSVSPLVISNAIATVAKALRSLPQWTITHSEHLEAMPPRHIIHFFGAGCGDEAGRQTIHNALFNQLLDGDSETPIHVRTDLEGTCRALLGDNASGFVGILGTGSNFCYHSPKGSPAANAFSLGYLLGDEGSGCHIGRLLLKAYLRGHLSPRMESLFNSRYPDTRSTYRQHIYAGGTPTRYLASFVDFAVLTHDEPETQRLLQTAFDAYMSEAAWTAALIDAPRNLYLSGGVAAQFADEVTRAAKHAGFTVCGILRDPIDALSSYCVNLYAHTLKSQVSSNKQ